LEINYHEFPISVTEAGGLSPRHNGACIFGKRRDNNFDRRLGASPDGGEIYMYQPVEMTYAIQLWGCTKPSDTAVIQRFQNKLLRNIVDAPWYVRNDDLHIDFNMEMVTAEIRRFARKH
jgi:hypothetical protein